MGEKQSILARAIKGSSHPPGFSNGFLEPDEHIILLIQENVMDLE